MVSTGVEKLRVTQIIDSWLEERKGNVSDSTYQIYSINVNRYFIPMFGDMTVEELTVEELNSKIEEYIYGSGIAYKRAHDIIRHLKSILKYIAKETDIFIDWNRLLVRSYEKKELTVLSDKDQKTLVRELLHDADTRQAGIIMCLYTGIQVSEICALKWADINLPEKYINVNKVSARIPDSDDSGSKTKLIVDVPKNKASVRKLPINTCIVKFIEHFTPKDGNSFFLTGTQHCYETRRMQCLLDKYSNELKIDKLNFLTVKNTFASNCIRAGCNAEELAKLMGYASGKLAYDAYEELFIKYNRGFSVELLPRIV